MTLLAFLLLAQTPSFEAVSVRVVPPNAPMVLRSADFDPVRPGGRYIDSSAMPLFLIAFAYDVKNPSVQLTGLPSWAKERTFSISATSGPEYPDLSHGENRERVRLMLRKMLEERFRLRLHTETKQEQVYELHIAKQGFQFPPVDPPVPPAIAGRVNAAMSDGNGTILATKANMAGMARMLEVFLKRPVIDRTGLTGYYDFDVRWNSPNAAAESSGLGADGIAQLISTLRARFGLELKSTKGPVKYWVVDRFELPTEN